MDQFEIQTQVQTRCGGICTFAYPYMNGRLHAGHAMTIVNADVACRWRKQQGEDVLFPFGFHCTGMPIYASAEKLKRGDPGVRESLLSMGVSNETIDKFKDPEHWIFEFPALAMQDLKRLNLMCDFSRSFVTTDINPYYDSFIRWQYSRLNDQGRLKYAKRPCIYSILDQQPCADHDRQSGEGVKPVAFRLYHLNGEFLIKNKGTGKGGTIQGSVSDMLIRLITENGIYCGGVSRYWYDNMKYQGLDIENTGEGETKQEQDQEDREDKIVLTDTGVDLWLPESPVVSRTGDRCIVACVPQWYITYSDPKWKADVAAALGRMTIHDPELRKQLDIALANMDDWCVSREYGLGTRLPCDPKFFIDSLSDSTIYMAYYTVCNKLHTDLYGHEGLVPIELVDNQFWDAVFLGRPDSDPNPISNPDPFETIIADMRKEYLRYYPPCLRVSGKDLIYNHLIMSIYHHVAILGLDMCCREYLVNGYAKLNGAKMSKSTGNFITLKDALDKYRVDALRVMLIEAGDGLEDANIRLKDYDNICSALDSCFIERERERTILTGPTPMGYHKLYYDMIRYCHRMAQRAFRIGKFREAITYGWRKCSKVISVYLKHKNFEQWIVDLGHQVCRYTMSPVLGTEEPMSLLFQFQTQTGLEDPVPEITGKYYELVQTIHAGINKSKNISSIEIHEQLRPHHSDLLEHVKNMHGIEIPIVFDNSILHVKRDPYRLKPKFEK